MTGELVRFGVAIDEELLARFDEHIARKGYQTRSEALRDLIRADLLDRSGTSGRVTGTLTLVYDHHVRELGERLTTMQHELGEQVVSTLHVHLDHDHCLEVVVLRGEGKVVEAAADRILATKGVVHGRLILTGFPGSENLEHHHPHPQPHGKTGQRKRPSDK